jgi:CubicO group peptidase (beta-lactamase class C family)
MTASPDRFGALRKVCEDAIASGVVPGAVVLAAADDTTRFHEAFGARQLVPASLPAAPDTIYDVASVTKAVVTSVLAMQAVAAGQLALDDSVVRFLPHFNGEGKEAVTIRHLLCHASGLPAHRPFYERFFERFFQEGFESPSTSGTTGALIGELAARRAAIGVAAAAEPLERPPLERSVYSDLGFILLGEILERCGAARLDVLARRQVIEPLALRSTTFVELDGIGGRVPLLSDVAATERCDRRGRVVVGEVHDLNAYAMGGIAGHAGLFSTAADLGRIAAALVAAWHGDAGGHIVSTDVIRQFWSPAGVNGSTWRLGWDGPAERDSQAGSQLSRQAVGHWGFTGCSLWIDPLARLSIVLLTNRVHPTVRDDPRFRAFRPAVHDTAVAGLLGT